MQGIQTRHTSFWYLIPALLVVFVVLVLVVYYFLPVNIDISPGGPFSIGGDWKLHFRPAIQSMLAGHSPYGFGVYNPPWILLLLVPIALLPAGIGSAVMFVSGLIGFAYAAYRMHASPWKMALFISCPFVIKNILNGNIDWLIALGCTLPPQWGLFLVIAKPQLGLGIMIFWLVEAYRKGKFREVLRVFAPVTAAFILSILIYGFWPLDFQQLESNTVTWNTSLGSAGFIIGIVLLSSALRKRAAHQAILASPFLSPYVSVHGWAISVFGLIPYSIEFIAAIIAAWIVNFVSW